MNRSFDKRAAEGCSYPDSCVPDYGGTKGSYPGEPEELSYIQIERRLTVIRSGNKWEDESQAPPVDFNALTELAKDSRAMIEALLANAPDQLNTTFEQAVEEDWEAIGRVESKVPRETADRLHGLIQKYKSWAMAWSDLIAHDEARLCYIDPDPF